MWPMMLAVLAAGALFTALPEHLALGPRWILLLLVTLIAIPGEVLHVLGHHRWCKIFQYSVISIVTFWLSSSVALLVYAIGRHTVEAHAMLASAAILWATNIITFAVWYWRLDAGGPHKRNMRHEHTDGAFLFPQMTIEGPTDHDQGDENWSPRFVDYLFLAFNTSTALSPTDVPVLSRWAKVLMMIQSALSLTIVALLAARAVNML
jgi:hypothetical protein